MEMSKHDKNETHISFSKNFLSSQNGLETLSGEKKLCVLFPLEKSSSRRSVPHLRILLFGQNFRLAILYVVFWREGHL